MRRYAVVAVLMWFAQTAPAEIRVAAVAVSADFSPGLPSFGSLASVFCTGLAPIEGVRSAESVPLPYEIAGVSVRVGGAPAPLLAVAHFGAWQQINIQVPPSSAEVRTVEVLQSGQTGRLDPPGPAAWGVFFTDAAGYAIVQHADYSLVTPGHPARPGEVLVAYATNLDSYAYVSFAPAIGSAAGFDPLPELFPSRTGNMLRIAPSVTVNGRGTEQFYSGLTPDSIGVFQVNFRLPEDTPAGDAILQAVRGTCFPFGGCGSITYEHSRTAKLPVGTME